MKRILISTTAATALIASFLVLTPRAANASTPVEKFKKMRAALAKAMQSGELKIDLTASKDGVVEVTCTLEGKPLPKDFPLYVETSREGNVMTVDVTADLNPENYSTIRYGKTQDTLELVPKADPNSKSEVVIDRKTMKPTSWRTMVSKDGLWGPASAADLAKARSMKSAKSDSTIHAKVKMMMGQDASIRVSGG